MWSWFYMKIPTTDSGNFIEKSGIIKPATTVVPVKNLPNSLGVYIFNILQSKLQ